MSLSFYIARRFFFRRGKRTLIHSISWLSVMTIALGLMALTVGLSIFNGLEQLLKSKFEDFEADLKIVPTRGKFLQADEALMAMIAGAEGVKNLSPIVEDFALAHYADRYAIVKMKGMLPFAPAYKKLEKHLRRGELSLGSRKVPKALLGEGVGYALGVSLDDYFNEITLSYPRQSLALVGKQYNQAVVKPAALLSLEPSLDEKLMIVPLPVARTLLGKKDASTAWELHLHEGFPLQKIKRWLQESVGKDRKVLDQETQHADLYRLFRTEKTFLFFLFVFILLTASLNSSFSLCMLVIEKKREIWLLSALGIKKSSLSKIFLHQAGIINVLGGFLGLVLGLGICYLQMKYQWFYIDAAQAVPFPYPVEISFLDVLLALLTLIPLCWLSALYPAYLARQMMAQPTYQSGLDES